MGSSGYLSICKYSSSWRILKRGIYDISYGKLIFIKWTNLILDVYICVKLGDNQPTTVKEIHSATNL